MRYRLRLLRSCFFFSNCERPRHASNSSTDIMRNTCAVSNTPVLQANTVNPTYFVLGGILGCVPIAYWLVQSCQVRCVCASVFRVSGLGHARPLFLCVHIRIIRAIMSADNAQTANIIDAHTANVSGTREHGDDRAPCCGQSHSLFVRACIL